MLVCATAAASDASDDDDSDEDEVADEVDDDEVLEPVELVCVLVSAADAWVGVVVACPSRQAIAPPSESIVATLRAVAALRAPAARGLRRGRRAPSSGRTALGRP